MVYRDAIATLPARQCAPLSWASGQNVGHSIPHGFDHASSGGAHLNILLRYGSGKQTEIGAFMTIKSGGAARIVDGLVRWIDIDILLNKTRIAWLTIKRQRKLRHLRKSHGARREQAEDRRKCQDRFQAEISPFSCATAKRLHAQYYQNKL